MPKLYLIPTPIGNLEDITFRAVRLLKEIHEVYAEDTRQSQKLLKHYGIEKKLRSYHKFSERKTIPYIIESIERGEDVALISDAGTPGISDPGMLLVRECISRGIEVDCLPGPVALIPALVMSGVNTEAFAFFGFLPHKKGRKTMLEKLALEDKTIILYESPHRILKTLAQLREHLGDRHIAAVREISKVFQETVTGSISELILHFEDRSPRGEFVLIISVDEQDRK